MPETEAEKIIREEKQAADILEADRKVIEAADKKETDKSVKLSKAEEIISSANAAAERQENANVKHEELLTRQAELQVERTLGGEAEAGTGNKEETPQEYKDRIMGQTSVKRD